MLKVSDIIRNDVSDIFYVRLLSTLFLRLNSTLPLREIYTSARVIEEEDLA